MKREVERLLGCGITKEQFEEALMYAERKQIYIFKRTGRKEVLQEQYLAKLTEEYAKSLMFSKLTMDLCRLQYEYGKRASYIFM